MDYPLTNAMSVELSDAFRNNDGNLGKVFALTESGPKTNRELVEGGAAANQGAAANMRVTVDLVFRGIFPKGPSVAQQSRRSIGGIIRNNPFLSSNAKTYLEGLRSQLEKIENDEVAIKTEDAEFERASVVLETELSDLPGVYVYTLPSLLRVIQKIDPERFWFKIGKTDRDAGRRIGEQMRATALPEDPFIARVYRHNSLTPKELETKFHESLSAAGHSRATGRYAGKEWYATNLEFLDTIAKLLNCEIATADDLC